jgi:hypothetical protein
MSEAESGEEADRLCREVEGVLANYSA